MTQLSSWKKLQATIKIGTIKGIFQSHRTSFSHSGKKLRTRAQENIDSRIVNRG